MRGDAHALPSGVVVPSMVRTNQTIVLHAPAGKLRAAVQAEILPRTNSRTAPPEDQVLSQQPRRAHLSGLHGGGLRHDVPIVE